MATQLTQDQIEHYMKHPEEVDATDETLIEALAQAELSALKDEESAVVDPTKAEPTAEAKATTEEKPAAEAKATPESSVPDKEGAVVSTPDGKQAIPYAVLKGEREGRAAAESALAEAQQTILSLAERVKAMEAGRSDPGAGDNAKSAEELRQAVEMIKAEAPYLDEGMAKFLGPIEKLITRVEATEALLADFTAQREETEAQHLQRLQSAADAALNGNATLVLWQAQAPELFEEACAFDKLLRSDAKQRERYPSFEARFERAVDLVKANHAGEGIPLPQPVSAPSVPAKGKPAAAQPTAAGKARADEALAQAAAQSVTTLSDIPGGTGDASAQDTLERMSIVDIAEKFGRMNTPQDILNWVQSH